MTAPRWMEDFQCIAENCPETCCRQWNIDVDPVHAESYTHLDDPELQPVLDQLLRKFRVRRPGRPSGELQYRLQLLSTPDQRCPLLDENGKCRLQKKYGAYILCDTCYFHPRTFFQIDEQITLSACLSCPECARLALLHREPTVFSRFEAEIDPNADWLETSLMTDPGARLLLLQRDRIVSALTALLTERAYSFRQRMGHALAFLKNLEKPDRISPETITAAAENAHGSPSVFPEENDLMQLYLEIFDPVSETLQKPAQGAAEFTRRLAGGSGGFAELLTGNYEKGLEIAEPFFRENEYLTENFMVHTVFSDSFRQFFRYQNEPVTVRDILKHESALLSVWEIFYRIQMAQAALTQQAMNEEIFLQTVIHADKIWWHYPDWFARCAERFIQYTGSSSRIC